MQYTNDETMPIFDEGKDIQSIWKRNMQNNL